MHIVHAVKTALSVLGTLAKYTATTVDDQIVAFLNAALENPAVLDLLESILNDHDVATHKDEARNAAMMAAVQKFDGSRIEKIKELLGAAGITWDFVISTLPLIVRLLLSLSGKR